MCGITGWVSYERDLRGQGERQILEAMTLTLQRRGPDASGTWVDEHGALGHRRLAVIDLAGGKQPMTVATPSGTVALTYTGEVYNFVELRDDLRRRGHHFHTTSDTEVVLVAYLEWGANLVDHLNGMFGFAIWDGRTQTLLLARDRLGIKPLYYYRTKDGVLFGSEPKAIFANSLAKPVVRLDGLRELFVCRFLQRYQTPTHAVMGGLSEVQAGEVVVVDRSGVRVKRYWQLQALPHEDTLDATIRKVEDLLQDIVPRQLVADVPRCLLLSGGLDSSALTALAAEYLKSHGETARTFAFDFVDAERFKPENAVEEQYGGVTRDSPFAAEAAKYIGTLHKTVLLDAGAMADPNVRRATVGARDLPSWHGNRDLSAYLLFKAIREFSTVALSGEGGDEVFGGYPWMSNIAGKDGVFPWNGADGMANEGSFVASTYSKALLARLDVGNTTKDSYAQAVADVPYLDGESGDEKKRREIGYLALTRYMRHLLDKKDRMSMAVGLEVRVPLVDHRLVEYMFNVPWAMKSFDGNPKSLLRSPVKDKLPPSVLARKKSSWPDTMDKKFFGILQGQLGELLRDPKQRIFEVFDRDALTSIVKLPVDEIKGTHRAACQRALDVSVWLELQQPKLDDA